MSKLTLKEAFTARFYFDISLKQAKDLMDFCMMYEVRNNHPQAFNTALLGVELPFFLQKDQTVVFDIFSIDRLMFEKVLESCLIVNQEMKVISDPYNLLTTWLMHLTFRSKLPQKIKEDVAFTLCKLLHYKFFTSIVNYNFPHRANEQIMTATIDGLSLKFDIKQEKTSTWKLLMEDRARDVVSKNSIHYRTLDMYSPDKKVVYILSDIQTRLRTKIKLVIREYYATKERGDKLGSYSHNDVLFENVNGRSIEQSYDQMVVEVSNAVLNLGTFIDNSMVKLICKLNTQLRPDLLVQALTKFSDRAVIQHRNRQSEQIKVSKNKQQLYIGYKILISKHIQSSYRSCILNKVNMRSKLAVLEHVRNIYRSSRIVNEDILSVKDSVDIFIKEEMNISREATIISLKLGIILYLILLSFKYI